MRLFATVIATALLLVPRIGAQDTPVTDANAVVTRSRQRLQTADFRATGHLARVDAKGGAHQLPHHSQRSLVSRSAAFCYARSMLLEKLAFTFCWRCGQRSGLNSDWPIRGDKAAVVLPFEKWSEGPIEGLGPGFSFSKIFWRRSISGQGRTCSKRPNTALVFAIW